MFVFLVISTKYVCTGVQKAKYVLCNDMFANKEIAKMLQQSQVKPRESNLYRVAKRPTTPTNAVPSMPRNTFSGEDRAAAFWSPGSPDD